MKFFTRSTASRSAAIALTMAMLITVGFYACKKPNEGINLIVNTTSLTKAPVLLHFVNANNTSATQPTDFNVTISGKDANLVQMDGGATTNFKVKNGFLPLSLLTKANPSPINPIKFNVYAEIAGFAPITQSIVITRDSATVIDVTAIEYANPVKGASVGSNTSTLNAGTSSGATIDIPGTAGMVENAKVTIPAGTQVRNANGSLINASSLTANVVNYSANSPTSYSAFPGGFSPGNIVDAAGNQLNGGFGVNFVSAGLMSIKMNAGGTEVKSFSQPISVSMELDPNTTNFTTGVNIKAGDTVPLWSLDEATGQWKSEGNVTITTSANGNPQANFTTTHLSCFNLDWTWAVAGQSFGTCNKPLTVTLKVGAGKSGYYDVALVTPSNQYLAAAHGEYVTDGKKVTFPSVPSIAQAKVVISDFNLYLNPRLPILAQTALFNPCTQGNIDLVYGSVPVAPDYITVNLNVTGYCSNKAININPTGWMYLTDKTDGKTSYIYVEGGVIRYTYGTQITGGKGSYSVKLINGHKYVMETYTSETYYKSGEFTLTKASFTLPATAGITVKGTYVSATSTLNISGSFNVNCK